MLVVLGVVLYVAVSRSLAAAGTAQVEARADQITGQPPDPEDGFPTGGFIFGGQGSGTFAAPGRTRRASRSTCPDRASRRVPDGLPLLAGIEAVQATGTRDIQQRRRSVVDTPVRVLTEPVPLRGRQFYLQVVGDRTTEVRTLNVVLVVVLVVGGVVALLVASGAGRRLRQPRARARSAARSSPSARPCVASASSRPTPRTSCARR